MNIYKIGSFFIILANVLYLCSLFFYKDNGSDIVVALLGNIVGLVLIIVSSFKNT